MNERNDGYSNHYPPDASLELLYFIELLKKLKKRLKNRTTALKLMNTIKIQLTIVNVFLKVQEGATFLMTLKKLISLKPKGFFLLAQKT